MKTIDIKFNKLKIGWTEILVDDEDFEKVNKFNWLLDKRGYVVCSNRGSDGKKLNMFLHRFILNLSKVDGGVDHIDGNKLNNQKSNLRLCKHAENRRNNRIYANNRSGYKGVSWNNRQKQYEAKIQVLYKNVFLGYFDNKGDAAKAYDEAAIEYYGEFANVNFPRQ